MPAMNGIEFVKEIRKLGGKESGVKIIVMSAFELSELGIDEQQEQLKIAELLDKPIMVSQLKAIVSKYMMTKSCTLSSSDTEELLSL
jgi:CheY-like chemotaxis protein